MRTKYFFLTVLIMLFSSFACAKSLEQIREDKIIRVGVLENYLPFSKMESSGNFKGFEIELAKAISKDIFRGISEFNIQFVPTRFTERIPFLINNNVDMVIALFPNTNQAQSQVDFSMPYLTLNTAILTRSGENITKLENLFNKKIALQTNTLGESFMLSKGFSKDKFVYIKWYKDGYKLLINKEVDAVIGDNVAMLGYPVIDHNVEVNQNNIGTYTFVSIGVSKGNKELLQTINDKLIELNQTGYFKKNYEETFDPFYKGTADRKYFLLDDVYSVLLN